jgi:hypothetical protein
MLSAALMTAWAFGSFMLVLAALYTLTADC